MAAATTVGWKPRLKAPRAVELTHMCVMKPASTRSRTPAERSRSSRSVPTKALGYCLVITGSSPCGATSSEIAPIAAAVSYGEPAPASWRMWITGVPLSRARRSSACASLIAGSTFASRISPSR